MTKKNNNRVSVVIPTYNSWTTLKECVKSIQNQTLKPSEIIIVDNASVDGTSDKIKSTFPKVKLISLKTNTGVTGGRNKGIEQSSPKMDYILFFDHDMVADKNMLGELLKALQSNPQIGIVTPKIYYWGNKKRIWSAGTGINLWTGQVLFRGGEDSGQYEEIEEVQVAPAAILVKKKLLDKLKYFDNTYFATYEDTDFCFRARKEGFKTFYAPGAVAYHKISWDPKDDAARILSRAYWVGRNKIIFMKSFGKNFFVFSLFIPVFTLHYLILALKFKRFKDWLSFLKGTLEGYFNLSLKEKELPFSYINLIRRSIGENVNTILDLGCGEGKLMQALSFGENWDVVGVDVSKESLDKAKMVAAYSRLILGDLEKTIKKLIDNQEKFDVVLCSQVLEHLPKDKGERVLRLMDKLALKRIVLSTPNGFMEQIEESLVTNNSHQKHISGWKIKDFTKRGFSVRGIGLILIWSHSGLARSKNKFVAILFRLVSFILSPLVYFMPRLSVNLLVTRVKENS